MDRWKGRLKMSPWDVSFVAAEQTLLQLGVGDNAMQIAEGIADDISSEPCAEVDYVGKAIRIAFAAVRENTRSMQLSVDGEQ